MLYKTMVLELLQQRPEIYDHLCRQRTVLSTLQNYSRELQTRHAAWEEQLSLQNPGSPTQIASEALEIALKELGNRLSCEPPAEDGDPISLKAPMTYLRRHTPH